MSTAEPIVEQVNELRVPSCIEIGLEASKRRNFGMARQMLRAAMENLGGIEDKTAHLIELMIHVADTYVNEGRYDQAKAWYTQALDRSQLSFGKNTLQTALLMAKLAEISVLQNDMSEFSACFENLMRAYLLSQETEPDSSTLLNALIDLSWSLSVQGHLNEAKPVNSLITQIKQMDEEDRLGTAVA